MHVQSVHLLDSERQATDEDSEQQWSGAEVDPTTDTAISLCASALRWYGGVLCCVQG